MYPYGISFLLLVSCATLADDTPPLYQMQNVQTRWVSFENPTGEPGEGGKKNNGAKGAAFASVEAGETKTLLNIQGSGIVRRMWFTLRHRSPEHLRSYVIRIYWDGEEKPAVEAPFGDFFGAPLGVLKKFQNELFASPEGRSFQTFIEMPFRKSARITFTNESDERLPQLYYDINLTLEEVPEDSLYFHAFWHRVPRTELGEDFEILPTISGRGRFLGTHIGMISGEGNEGWWGEGEVKMYVDGDSDFPTLIGTGTEDYVGTAYGQGEYVNRFTGSWLIDERRGRYSYYRYHIPDPVFFQQDIRVTLQQLGGTDKAHVLDMQQRGIEIEPVSVQTPNGEFHPLYKTGKALDDPNLPDGWTNHYRRDDMCAVAFFYLDAPANNLPPIQDLQARIQNLKAQKD